MLELNKIYNMDCMEGIKEFPDKYFELAICDPPYGIGIGTMNYTKSGAVRTHGKSLAKRRDYRRKADWDSFPPDQEYFQELFRVSQNQIIWGGNYFSEHLPSSKSYVVWDKRTEEKYKNDFADCEYAWCSIGVARVYRYLWNGMLQGNMKNKEDRFHPTQKPIALYEWLIKTYAKPGDKIISTHGGSCPEMIAAYNLGFDCISFEVDSEYYHKAVERLEAVKSQVRFAI